MRFDKFTLKVQEAIQEAQSLCGSLGHQSIEPEHLLVCFLRQEESIANAIITPDVYEKFKHVIIYEKFLLIEGALQNQQDVISVKAHTIRLLEISAAEVRSHDFH